MIPEKLYCGERSSHPMHRQHGLNNVIESEWVKVLCFTYVQHCKELDAGSTLMTSQSVLSRLSVKYLFVRSGLAFVFFKYWWLQYCTWENQPRIIEIKLSSLLSVLFQTIQISPSIPRKQITFSVPQTCCGKVINTCVTSGRGTDELIKASYYHFSLGH